MASRRDESVNVKKKAASSTAPATPSKKGAAPKTAPQAPSALVPPPAAPRGGAPASAKGLLHAGLKALGNVRDDVVQRQSNVIDSLLGVTPKSGAASESKGALPRAFPGLDPFGIRKFEDVFDQRVATALQHLGVPTPQEFQELRDEVKRLREQLREAQAPKPAVRRKR